MPQPPRRLPRPVRWLLRALAALRPRRRTDRWTADFSAPERARFALTSESAFDARVLSGAAPGGPALSLALRRPGCLAWVEAEGIRPADCVIRFRAGVDARGGHAAAGVCFRMVDAAAFYLFLVSNRGSGRSPGRFRLDAFRNGTPLPLIDWTDLPAADGAAGDAGPREFTVIAYGDHLVMLAGDDWLAALDDSTLRQGAVAFAAVCYEPPEEAVAGGYAAEARLEAITIDDDPLRAAERFEEWTGGASASVGTGNPKIPDERRLALARTFAAMGQRRAALAQLRRADPAADPLLGARLAREDGLWDEAEAYLARCPAGRDTAVERASLYYAAGRTADLAAFCGRALETWPGDPVLWNLLGHARWESGSWAAAGEAYDRAFAQDRGVGIFAENAANAWERAGAGPGDRLLAAGRAYLAAGDHDALGLLAPRLLAAGGEEAHELAARWAFAVGDWDTARAEAAQARGLELLRARLLMRDGDFAGALPLLEAATEPEAALPRAECRFRVTGDPFDEQLWEDLNAALARGGDAAHRLAAEVCLAQSVENAAPMRKNPRREDTASQTHHQGLGEAARHLEKIDAPELKGRLLYLQGDYEAAARILAEAAPTPDTLRDRADCLIRLGRLGEADAVLAQAHRLAPTAPVLDLIALVATRKGEHSRAEAACRAALELDPAHLPAAVSLGWTLITLGRPAAAAAALAAFGAAAADPAAAALRARLDELLYRVVPCASCARSWKVSQSPPSDPPLRLVAQPPDDLPAGSCPVCGKTWCVGCARRHVAPDGRFVCPVCGRPLKLTDEGLKHLLVEWSRTALRPGAEGSGPPARTGAEGVVQGVAQGGPPPSPGEPPRGE